MIPDPDDELGEYLAVGLLLIAVLAILIGAGVGP